MNDEEKGLIDDREQPSSEDNIENCEHEVPPGDTDQPMKPLFGSSKVIFIFSLAQILARPFIITVNIIYLILRQMDDLNQSLNEPEGYYFTRFTGIMMYQETAALISDPINDAIYWVCCWRQCRTNNSCRKYLELLRFTDLQFIIITAPFSNVHLYALGALSY